MTATMSHSRLKPPHLLAIIAAGWLLHGNFLCDTARAAEPPARVEGEVQQPPAEKFVNVLGEKYHLPGPGECQAVVLIFYGHECPISNRYAPEIIRLCKEYSPRQVSFCVVYAEPDLTADEAAKHAKEYGFNCPAILDPKLTLARKVGATITPEVAVLSPRGAVMYLGRIDDRYYDLGKPRAEATHFELHDALEAVLTDKPVVVSRAAAVGCKIELPHGDVSR